MKIGLISQLIKGILRVAQKLLKYSNGTNISASVPLSQVWPVNFALELNEPVALAPLNWIISTLLFTVGKS